MKTIRETDEFKGWLQSLRDVIARRQIVKRLGRIATMDHFGDFGSVGEGVSELRIHVGPGYRVYYALRGEEVVIILCGGDKDDQDRDIKRAKEMAAQLE
jgi:putative addiction module killer protein